MRTSRIVSAITLVSSLLIFLSFVEVLPQVVASASQTTEGGTNPDDEVGVVDVVDDVDDDDEGEEPTTCSLDPSSAGGVDCYTSAPANADEIPPSDYHHRSLDDAMTSLAGRVVHLTDDNFDDLTTSSSTHHHHHHHLPSTWLIMFKTDSCGICKKVVPILEALVVDGDIVSHNEPIYVATIDAGWHGADTTKRFGVDATPTIILLRNEGGSYAGGDDDGSSSSSSSSSSNVVDSRSYYVFREQRALYPLRKFVLGGYQLRKRIDVPPPLPDEERKPRSRTGRLYEHYLSPGANWAGGVIGKILLVWFGFMGILGLCMRVHNYAWGGDGDDDGEGDADRRERHEREIESEKARGREGYEPPGKDEKTANRQRLMWERKEANRARFAARQEARKAREEGDAAGDVIDDDDDEMRGEGVSVKKSDAKKVTNVAKKKKKT
jgi:hypothetical protein